MISQKQYAELILFSKKIVSTSKYWNVNPMDLVHDAIITGESDVGKLRSLIYGYLKSQFGGEHVAAQNQQNNTSGYAEIKICKHCSSEKLCNDFGVITMKTGYKYFDNVCKKCRATLNNATYKDLKRLWIKKQRDILSDYYLRSLLRQYNKRNGVNIPITKQAIEKKKNEVIERRKISELIKKNEHISDGNIVAILTDKRLRNHVKREDVTREMIESKKMEVIARRKNKRI